MLFNTNTISFLSPDVILLRHKQQTPLLKKEFPERDQGKSVVLTTKTRRPNSRPTTKTSMNKDVSKFWPKGRSVINNKNLLFWLARKKNITNSAKKSCKDKK